MLSSPWMVERVLPDRNFSIIPPSLGPIVYTPIQPTGSRRNTPVETGRKPNPEGYERMILLRDCSLQSCPHQYLQRVPRQLRGCWLVPVPALPCPARPCPDLHLVPYPATIPSLAHRTYLPLPSPPSSTTSRRVSITTSHLHGDRNLPSPLLSSAVRETRCALFEVSSRT